MPLLFVVLFYTTFSRPAWLRTLRRFVCAFLPQALRCAMPRSPALRYMPQSHLLRRRCAPRAVTRTTLLVLWLCIRCVSSCVPFAPDDTSFCESLRTFYAHHRRRAAATQLFCVVMTCVLFCICAVRSPRLSRRYVILHYTTTSVCCAFYVAFCISCASTAYARCFTRVTSRLFAFLYLVLLNFLLLIFAALGSGRRDVDVALYRFSCSLSLALRIPFAAALCCYRLSFTYFLSLRVLPFAPTPDLCGVRASLTSSLCRRFLTHTRANIFTYLPAVADETVMGALFAHAHHDADPGLHMHRTGVTWERALHCRYFTECVCYWY